MKSNKYIWFSLFLKSKKNFISYTQSSIHLVFVQNQNTFPIVRRAEWESSSCPSPHWQTSAAARLWRTSPVQAAPGHGWPQGVHRQILCHTLSLRPRWSQDVVLPSRCSQSNNLQSPPGFSALTFIWVLDCEGWASQPLAKNGVTFLHLL